MSKRLNFEMDPLPETYFLPGGGASEISVPVTTEVMYRHRISQKRWMSV